MISTKKFTNVDGKTKRFLSDFIIPSDQHVRVYVSNLDTYTGSNLVYSDKYDIIDNSIVFYVAPTAGSLIVFEVATTPEEFGSDLSLPAVDIVENNVAYSATLIQDITDIKDLSLIEYNSILNNKTIIDGYVASAYNSKTLASNDQINITNLKSLVESYKLSAETSYLEILQMESDVLSITSGSIKIANDALILAQSNESYIAALDAQIYDINNAVTILTDSVNQNTVDVLNLQNIFNNTINTIIGYDDRILLNASKYEEYALDAASLKATQDDLEITIPNLELSIASLEADIPIIEQDILDVETNISLLQSDVTAVETLANTLDADIDKRYQGSMTAFPTINVVEGTLVYRSDLEEIYQRRGTSWVKLFDLASLTVPTYYKAPRSTAYNIPYSMYYNTTYNYIELYKDSLTKYRIPMQTSTGNLVGMYDSAFFSDGYNVGTLNFVPNYDNLYSNLGRVYMSGAYCTIEVLDQPAAYFGNSLFLPGTDATTDLGSSTYRFKDLYLSGAVIQTSDIREKTEIQDISEVEKRVALKLKGIIKTFKFIDAVAKKGDAARIHIGVMAQEVVDVFASEGLNAHDYGILMYNQWDASPEQLNDDGTVMMPAVEAGDRFGIRYTELLAFIVGAM